MEHVSPAEPGHPSPPARRLPHRPPPAQRWPALLACVAVGLAYLALSERLIVGPRWWVAAAVLACLAPLWLALRRDQHTWVRRLGLLATGLVSLALAASTARLVLELARGRAGALILLSDAALIWLVNILVFALWYWELDGGGPAARHASGRPSTDFVFPQMTYDGPDCRGWRPHFVDYLFLAFNTSTAFSPTDTLVLARRAKLLMMAQALIALVVVAVLAARAINTLGS